MTTNTPRPKWDFDLTEKQVQLLRHNIKKITTHSEPTGVDSSREWMEFHYCDGKFRAPAGWNNMFEFRGWWPSLIAPTMRGFQAIERLNEIEEWERKNTSERAEYQRLKLLFEGEE